MGKFEITRNGKNWHFVLKAKNNEVILTSESYTSTHGTLIGIDSVKVNCLEDKCFERLVSKNNKDYFVLKAKNGEIIGVSETYESSAAMENGIASVKTNAPESGIFTIKLNE